MKSKTVYIDTSLTVPQIVERYGVSRSTAYRARKTGKVQLREKRTAIPDAKKEEYYNILYIMSFVEINSKEICRISGVSQQSYIDAKRGNSPLSLEEFNALVIALRRLKTKLKNASYTEHEMRIKSLLNSNALRIRNVLNDFTGIAYERVMRYRRGLYQLDKKELAEVVKKVQELYYKIDV